MMWKEASGGRTVLFFSPLVGMLPCPLPLLHLLFVASIAFAQSWEADPFIPPAIPLAVKSPYLQTWSRQGAAEGSLDSGWASFRDKSV